MKEDFIIKYTIEHNPTSGLWNVWKNILGEHSTSFKSIFKSESKKECKNYCKENNITVSRSSNI